MSKGNFYFIYNKNRSFVVKFYKKDFPQETNMCVKVPTLEELKETAIH